jgi:plastocyanin
MNMKSLPEIYSIAAIAALLCLARPLDTHGATVNVSVENDFFSPSSVSVNVNDTVLWTWPSGSDEHNVTSDSSTQAWTASPTENGPVTFSHTFTTAGSFPYECTIHADCCGMVGSVTVAAAPNVPPTVTITNPAAGAVFRAPANVTIHATTSDSDATVTNVQFLIGSTVLTNVTSAPFNASTNNLAAGDYTLSAVAADNVGEKNTNSVSIIVDAPPAVAITNPGGGTVLSAPANVTIQASVSSPGGTVTSVQFLVGSTVVSNRTASPYAAITNNLAAGTYTLAAIATDNLGVATTNSLTISVVTPVPATLGTLQHSAGAFQFSYTANAGLRYVVQATTNLTAPVWVSLSTNQAAGSPMIFEDDQATNNPEFYRVERLPNP